MKKQTIYTLIGIVIILMAIGVYSSRKPVEKAVANNPISVYDLQPTVNNLPDSSIQTDLNKDPLINIKETSELSQIGNGIEITVKNVTFYDKGIQVTVCYPLFDSGEWNIKPEPLVFGSERILPDERELISSEPASAEKQGNACVHIRYLIEDKSKVTTPIYFTVSELFITPREMDPCEELKIRQATNMMAQQAGIEMQCTQGEEWKPDIQVANSKASLEDENSKLAIEQLSEWKVDGPWEFTINEIK